MELEETHIYIATTEGSPLNTSPLCTTSQAASLSETNLGIEDQKVKKLRQNHYITYTMEPAEMATSPLTKVAS